MGVFHSAAILITTIRSRLAAFGESRRQGLYNYEMSKNSRARNALAPASSSRTIRPANVSHLFELWPRARHPDRRLQSSSTLCRRAATRELALTMSWVRHHDRYDAFTLELALDLSRTCSKVGAGRAFYAEQLENHVALRSLHYVGRALSASLKTESINCGLAASPGKLSVRLKNSVATACCPFAAAALSNPSVRAWLSREFAATSVACVVSGASPSLQSRASLRRGS